METPEARLKRMAMRSWRRGTKEMDLVLGPYADAQLATMTLAELDAYDALLAENDQDLMAWMMGQKPAPDTFAPLIATLAAFAARRLRAG
jgi:antitoxin CptB